MAKLVIKQPDQPSVKPQSKRLDKHISRLKIALVFSLFFNLSALVYILNK